MNNNNDNSKNDWALIGEDWDDVDNNELCCWDNLTSATTATTTKMTPYHSSATISADGSERSQSPLGMLESEYFSAIQPTNNNNGGGDSCYQLMYQETTRTSTNINNNNNNNFYYDSSPQVSSQDSRRTTSVDSFDSLAAMVSKSIEVGSCTSRTTIALEKDYKRRDSMKRLWGGGGGCSDEESEHTHTTMMMLLTTARSSRLPLQGEIYCMKSFRWP